MKKHNLLAVILLGVLALSCQDEKISFDIDASGLKGQYQPQETLPLTVTGSNKTVIDSVVYYLNDTKIGTAKGNAKFDAPLKNQKFGYQNIKALVYYDGKNAEATTRVELVSNIEPKIVNYEIVNVFPHDTASYTQGLEFYRDTLVEGTGQYQNRCCVKQIIKPGRPTNKLHLMLSILAKV